MDLNIQKQTILDILHRVGPQDLSVPDEARRAIAAKPFCAPYLKSLTDFAESYRGKPIPELPYSAFRLYHDNGNRAVFEDGECGYFPRRGRLAAFGMLAWLYERPEDLAELEDLIWAICNEYTWAVPAHLAAEEGRNAFVDKLENNDYMVDLFASETGQALAEIAYLFGDRLSPIVRKRIAHELEVRIFSRVENVDFGWMHITNNWASVCAGAVGMAAIHAIEDEDRLADILSRLLPAFGCFLSGFAADGSCLEGIGYWNYGLSYFVAFADLLHRRTAGELDLFADPLVHKIALFQQKCYLPGGRTISFSDGSAHSHYHMGLSSYLSKKYADVQLPPASCSSQDFVNGDHCHRWSNVLRDLLWAVENHDDAPVAAQTHLLPAAQWYIAAAPNGVSLAAKAGNNDEPHNHNDVGSFQLFCRGEEMLADLGSGEYTRKYFSDRRYEYLVCGSQGHNLPLIDGCTQNVGPEACGKNISLTEAGLSLDMAPAYGLDHLPALQRDIRFDNVTGGMTLTDTFTLTGEHTVTERFIARGKVTVSDGCAHIAYNGEELTLHFDPDVFTATVTETTYPGHLGIIFPVTLLDLTVTASGAFTASFRAECR